MGGQVDELSARGPLLARSLVAAVTFIETTLPLAFIYDARGAGWKYVFAGGCSAALWTLQVFYFSRPGIDRRSPLTYGLLAFQALLTFGPILPIGGEAWVGQPCLTAGTVLVVFRGWIRWAAYGATILLAGCWQFAGDGDPFDLLYLMIASGYIALVIYGVTRLADLITELRAARAALAAAAVAHERLGFARDVNGRLGIALASIEPSGQLALRWLRSNTVRAQQALTEIQAVARSTLSDLRAVARSYRTAAAVNAGGRDQLPGVAVRGAQWILLIVLCSSVCTGILRVNSYTDDPFDLGLSIGCYLLMLAIQAGYFARPTVVLRSWPSRLLLGVQALVVYLPPAVFGWSWLTWSSFLAGTALLVLPAVAGVSAFVLVVASVGVLAAITNGNLLAVVFNAGGVLVVGLMVFGLTWMVRTMSELRETQLRLDQVAVAEERLRLSRDLHDLLGMTLSAIALKSDLAGRIAADAPDRARVEVDEVLTITRRALLDVRGVVDTGRELSLERELREAAELLRAAGVTMVANVEQTSLPTAAATLLATVLREGVTNVLRHSAARRVDVTLVRHSDLVELYLVNDGATGLAPRTDGSGLDNLAHRMAAANGSLATELEPGGRFRLVASLPMSWLGRTT